MSERTLTLLGNRTPEKVKNFQKSNLLAPMLLIRLADVWQWQWGDPTRRPILHRYSLVSGPLQRPRTLGKCAVLLHLPAMFYGVLLPRD